MRRTLVSLAILILLFATAVTAQEKQIAKAGVPQLETQVRQLWEAFKNKDKAALSSMVDDQFGRPGAVRGDTRAQCLVARAPVTLFRQREGPSPGGPFLRPTSRNAG